MGQGGAYGIRRRETSENYCRETEDIRRTIWVGGESINNPRRRADLGGPHKMSSPAGLGPVGSGVEVKEREEEDRLEGSVQIFTSSLSEDKRINEATEAS